jgi:hypothetical protein
MVILNNRRMSANAQFRFPVRLMGKVAGVSPRETRNPVPPTDGGAFFHIDQIKMYGHIQVVDFRATLHSQSTGPDPGQPDPGTRVNLITPKMIQ